MQMSSSLIRRGGLAAMLGGILGLLHSPFYAVAYFATEGGAESLEAPWVAAWSGAFRSLFEPLLTFAPPEVVYLTYGKLFLFMFLGWLAGLLALHARQTVRAGRLEKWGFRVALAGAVLGTLGSIGAYWIGSVWRGAVNFSFLAFLVPALLLFNIGFPLFGFGTLRAKVAPRLGAWLLTVGGFPGIFLLTFLLGNLGIGMVLLNLAWVVLGYALWSGKDARQSDDRERDQKVMKGRILPLAKLISLGVLLTLVVLIPGGQALAQDVLPQPDQPLSPATRARELTDPKELENFLDGVMSANLEGYHVPGATVSVVKDGELFFAKGYGYADLKNREPVVAGETLFRAGSVGKPFTATAVMQLVEEGKLDLNADVNTYLKDFKIPDTYPQPITLHHLLTHTAGFEDRYKGIKARNADDIRPLGEFLAEDMPARVRPPGELAAYSNYSLSLAGYIVQQVSGMSYDRYVEENILEPLDMGHSTTRQPPPPGLAGNMAVGYTYENGGYEAEEFEFYNIAPAGSMSATATDMAHFMIAHLQNGRYGDERILQEDTAKEMHRRHFAHDPKVNGIAYGFVELDRNDQQIIGHSGETDLFRTLLVLLPEQEVGLFLSYNSAGGEEARNELFEAFLDRYYPVPDSPAGKPPADFQERAGRFTGSYESTRAPQTTPEKLNALTQTRSVSVAEDGTLLTQGTFGGDPQRWVEVEPLVFREVGGQETMVFREDRQGRITHLFPGVPPTVAYVRLAWYETPAFHVGLLVACVVLFLSAIALWPIGALLGRRKGGAGAPRPGLSRLARWLAGGAGALSILYLIGFAIAWSNRLELIYGDTPLLHAMGVLPLLIAVLAVGALAFTVPAWRRRYWGVAGRVHYTLVALAGLAFVWFMYYWNLLEELWF